MGRTVSVPGHHSKEQGTKRQLIRKPQRVSPRSDGLPVADAPRQVEYTELCFSGERGIEDKGGMCARVGCDGESSVLPGLCYSEYVFRGFQSDISP